MKRLIYTLYIVLGCCSMLRAQNLYVGSLYVTTPDEEKLYGDGGDKWTTRLGIIGDLFNFEQPDVLCLQSYTDTQLSQLSRRLTSHEAAGDILYSKALELDTCGTVSDMPEGSVCSWARLRKEGKSFYVFNICFSTDATICLNSASRVRTALGEINTGNLPCFVIGYLGVSETKTPYTRMVAKLADCYTQAPVVSAEYGTVSNFDLEANHGTERYDFVFASRNITVRAYGQLQSAYYTQEQNGTYKRRLPSAHFPVMAKVSLPK